MTDELKFPGSGGSADRDSLGEPLTSMIRDAYAPAASDADAYWAGLESRIMARVRSEGERDAGWWSVMVPWARVGLIAAAAIFAVASVVNQRISESDSQYAYESVVQTSAPDVDASAALLASPDRLGGSDATLDYVLSH